MQQCVEEKLLIKKLEKDDFDAFAANERLWHRVPDPKAYLEWIFKLNFDSHASYIAILENKVVGYYRNNMWPLKVGNKNIKAFFGEIFVDPLHRNTRYPIFTRLLSAGYQEIARQKGLIYGFPTARSVVHHHKRYHTTILKKIPRYELLLNFRHVLKRTLQAKSPGLIIKYMIQQILGLYRLPIVLLKKRNMAVREIQSFDERFDVLWEKASPYYPILSVRNRTYLQWRYVMEPGQTYTCLVVEKNNQILAYAILKKETKENRPVGVIVDLFGIPTTAIFFCLLQAVVDYFLMKKVDKIECYMSNPPCEKILRGFGFLTKIYESKRSDRLLTRSYSPEVKNELILNPDDWFITDTDMLLS